VTLVVGFQGEPGAFSEEAASLRFDGARTRGYRTFDMLVDAVVRGEVNYGLLPCENTIAGSIARAYDLLYARPEIAIVDEATHRIEQTLIGTRDAQIESLVSVASHPVALDQCRRFFAEHPQIEALVVDDTAGAVRSIVERGDVRCGAIGPALAAERYGGRILARDVADDTANFTRFFVISRTRKPLRGRRRVSMSFVLPDAPGSLHRALGVLADRDINLRSLIARPLVKRPFEYVFHVDLEDVSEDEVSRLAASLGTDTRVLGWY
jgi:prephenate dehydratase